MTRTALNLPIVARSFRGATLYLETFAKNSGALCCWTSDQSKAHVFDSTAAAYGAAAFCAVYWGADCVAKDGDGTLLQPAAARRVDGEPRGVAKAREFARIITADIAEHGPHCDEHAGFTDGCAECYAVHRERTH